MSQFVSAAIGKILQIFRQLFRFGHLGSLYQDGYDGNVAIQRRRDLDAYQVSRAVDARRGAAYADPTASDDRKEYGGTVEPDLDLFAEIQSGQYGRDIDKDLFTGKFACQVAMQTSGLSRGILAAIANEDTRNRRLLLRKRPHCHKFRMRFKGECAAAAAVAGCPVQAQLERVSTHPAVPGITDLPTFFP